MVHSGLLGQRHFDLAKQVAFIQGHGATCVIFPVLQCPCLLADRQFSPTCPSCHGTGRLYPPETAYSTTLLLHREDSRRTFEDAGTWTSGTIRATILPDVRLCERDKVRLLDITDTFTDEVLTRGVDDTLRFQHGVVLRLVADRDRVYRPGIDYGPAQGGEVPWLPGGSAPAFLSQYSVKYDAEPEFLVVNDTPRLRVEYHVPQSQEVVLMRLDKLSDDF
jgi:hypothetical protein